MPSSQTTQLKTQPIYDLSGGMVTNYSYTKVKANQVKLIKNGDLTTDGSVVTRFGRSKVNTVSFGAYVVNSIFSLGQTSGADLLLAGLYSSSVGSSELRTSSNIFLKSYAGSEPLSGAMMNDYIFLCNGSCDPFLTNGTLLNTYGIGIAAGTSDQIYQASGYPGTKSTAGNHYFAYRYRSTVTGARSNPYIDYSISVVHLGECYAISIDPFGTTPTVVSSDAQVDCIDIFVTTAGSASDSPRYYLGTCPNVAGITQFDVSDDELMIRETMDIDDNVAPVALRDIINYKGRMLAISGDYTVNFSKKRVDANGVVNLPTSWPATNELNVGWGDGDPLVKLAIFNDYVFAFKRRSIWMLIGDLDSNSFQFKQLKTNFTNTGLLNKRCMVQAGDSVYFVSDDLKFHRFRMTDFSTEELRLQDPPPSDRIANLFTSMASAYRQYVNVVNYTFAQYTQIWIAFSDGSDGAVAGDNYSTFVFDYTSDNGNGAWHVHTGHEIASSCLAKASDNNYYIYSGDYQGYVWCHDQSLGDGAVLNFNASIDASGSLVTNVDYPSSVFTPSMEGCLLEVVSNTRGDNVLAVRRVHYLSGSLISVSPAFPGSGVGVCTIGGIDLELQSRDDWLDNDAPPDYDKQGWYIDFDLYSENLSMAGTGPLHSVSIEIYINRSQVRQDYVKEFTYLGAVWGSAIWGSDVWPDPYSQPIQVGLNVFFRQISHRIISRVAGQRIRVNGWTYHYQQLGKLRVR